MHRHAGAEDTEAVASVTSAVSAELTSELAWVASAELAPEVLAEIIWRAFLQVPLAMRREPATERGLVTGRAFATERAFSVIAFRFLQRLPLRKM
jgi:hypothetical protein